MLKGDKCVTKCTLDKRPQPPGMQQTGRRRKLSDRALQLREKQKARHSYGVLEKQFRGYYANAVRLPGVTGQNLVRMLEMRLDNVILRMGFADSLKQARQVVRHGHIMLNGRKTDVPSVATKAGDVIGWVAGSKNGEYYKFAQANIGTKSFASWVNVDTAQMTGRILSIPDVANLPTKFDPAVIVEYYSR